MRTFRQTITFEYQVPRHSTWYFQVGSTIRPGWDSNPDSDLVYRVVEAEPSVEVREPVSKQDVNHKRFKNTKDQVDTIYYGQVVRDDYVVSWVNPNGLPTSTTYPLAFALDLFNNGKWEVV